MMRQLFRRSVVMALIASLACTALASAPIHKVRGCQSTVSGTAVIYPVVFDKSGTKTSRESAVASIREVFQTAGYTLISQTVAPNAWQKMHLPVPTVDSPARPKDLALFGKSLKSDYVVGSKFHFHSRSIWVDMGPKTVSTVTVDIFVFDVKQNKIVYKKTGVEGRSDARGKVLDMAKALLGNPLPLMVSGGPKTPHEQRAAEIAVTKALRGWVKPGASS